MNTIQQEMIHRARQQHQEIFPCTSRNDLSECFTVEEGKVLFWYNTGDQTTHMMLWNPAAS